MGEKVFVEILFLPSLNINSSKETQKCSAKWWRMDFGNSETSFFSSFNLSHSHWTFPLKHYSSIHFSSILIFLTYFSIHESNPEKIEQLRGDAIRLITNYMALLANRCHFDIISFSLCSCKPNLSLLCVPLHRASPSFTFSFLSFQNFIRISFYFRF